MEQKYLNRNLLEILQKLGIGHKIWLANTNELIKFSILKYENDTGKKIAWGLDKWAVTEIINGSTIGIHYPERYMINYLKDDDWLAEFSGMKLGHARAIMVSRKLQLPLFSRKNGYKE